MQFHHIFEKKYIHIGIYLVNGKNCHTQRGFNRKEMVIIGLVMLIERKIWTMSDMVKYRATIWSFLKLTALYFTMSDIVEGKIFKTKVKLPVT